MNEKTLEMKPEFEPDIEIQNQESSPHSENNRKESRAIPTFKELLQEKEFASEFDKRISNAIKTAREKWEEESKLTAEELANKKFEDSKKALEEREREFELKEFRADIKEELLNNNLPVAFADVLAVGTSRENYKKVLSEIKQEWDKQLQEQIKSKARQQEPKASEYKSSYTTDNVNLDLAELAKQNRKI